MRRAILKAGTIALSLLLLSGCTTINRPDGPVVDSALYNPDGFAEARFSASDPAVSERMKADITAMPGREGRRYEILALSGGGADGAFGAGALIGWTERGDRPEFELVTGVSTGALIAPFAFLGPDYDAKLTEAYTSGLSDSLKKSRGVMSLFTPGFLSSQRLEALIGHFIDDNLIRAIATEHKKGRRLWVATTNLDSQTGVVWDIGSICLQAVEDGRAERLIAARDLVRRILIASSSVPGAFAPVLIETHGPSGERLQEMHVDGGVTLPFFILPETLMSWEMPQGFIGGGHIYVVVNGKISPQYHVTTYNAFSIMSRSLETLTKAQARTSLITIEGFALRNALGLSFTALPDDYSGGGLLAFDTDSMQTTFAYGRMLAQSGKLWRVLTPGP